MRCIRWHYQQLQTFAKLFNFSTMSIRSWVDFFPLPSPSKLKIKKWKSVRGEPNMITFRYCIWWKVILPLGSAATTRGCDKWSHPSVDHFVRLTPRTVAALTACMNPGQCEVKIHHKLKWSRWQWEFWVWVTSEVSPLLQAYISTSDLSKIPIEVNHVANFNMSWRKLSSFTSFLVGRLSLSPEAKMRDNKYLRKNVGVYSPHKGGASNFLYLTVPIIIN